MIRFIFWCLVCFLLLFYFTTNKAYAENPQIIANHGRLPDGLEDATIIEIQNAMSNGILTSEELVKFYVNRIQNYDNQGPKINSFITLNEQAIETAKKLDQERLNGNFRGPLHGIPLILKDNYDTYDMPTSAGVLALKNSVPPDDGFLVKQLRNAGAIIIGKANLAEFAYGYHSKSTVGGVTVNPYNLAYNPGGSSGGTAAAIAANFSVAGLGTDTAGSIRIPASFNNIVGLRPTTGLLSRDGIIPLALTQDTGGPMARTVEDLAILLDILAGYDPADSVTSKSKGNIPISYTNFLDVDGLKGARIGVVRELFGVDPHVISAMEKAIKDMEKLGAKVVDVSIPNLNKILSYPSLSYYEFKFQFNDYLKSLGGAAPYQSLSEVIESGKYNKKLESGLILRNNRLTLSSKSYNRITFNRPKLARDSLMEVFNQEKVIALLYPTSPYLPRLNGKAQAVGRNIRLSPYAGYPAISVPAGFSPNGLPIGLELLGPEFSEPILIKLAYAYQEGTHHRKEPNLN